MSFLGKSHVGLNLRIYAPKAELVSKTVEQVVGVIKRARGMCVGGENVFSRIDVLVQSDPRYIDCDCGKTADALTYRLRNTGTSEVGTRVANITHGDLYVGANNEGIRMQREAGMDYSMFLSPGLLDYFVEENMALIVEALNRGVLAAGIAMEPFVNSVMEGRLLDTFDIWRIESLMSIGGYDPLAAQPTKVEKARKETSPLFSIEHDQVSGADEYVYTYAGVEEMIPLIRLARKYGACIAPIIPAVKGGWTIQYDPDVVRRERLKIISKESRQRRVCVVEGVTFDFIWNGVMPEYRK